MEEALDFQKIAFAYFKSISGKSATFKPAIAVLQSLKLYVEGCFAERNVHHSAWLFSGLAEKRARGTRHTFRFISNVINERGDQAKEPYLLTSSKDVNVKKKNKLQL